MKRIEVFEKAMNEGGSLKDYGINSTLFAAYRDCQETGNDNIDFNGVIWDYDIPEIVKALKENGISEFTISSTFSSLIETLAAFEKEPVVLVIRVGQLTVSRAKPMHIRMFQVTVPVLVPAQWSLRSLAYITASSRTILN